MGTEKGHFLDASDVTAAAGLYPNHAKADAGHVE